MTQSGPPPVDEVVGDSGRLELPRRVGVPQGVGTLVCAQITNTPPSSSDVVLSLCVFWVAPTFTVRPPLSCTGEETSSVRPPMLLWRLLLSGSLHPTVPRFLVTLHGSCTISGYCPSTSHVFATVAT